MEENLTLTTRPLSPTEELLRLKFDEEIVNQAQRMDDIARLLVAIELAVPGLYATALKLISGDKASLTVGPAVYVTFLFWFAALALTLIALLPRSYQVNRNTFHGTPPDDGTKSLSIEGYFKKVARYKYHCIVVSCLCFFVGTGAAVYSIL